MLVNQTSPGLLFEDSVPVDIHIRIYLDGSQYIAELRLSGAKTQRFRIGLTPFDIVELNNELQQAIEDISNKWEEDVNGIDLLVELASAGRSAFNRIFTEGPPRQTIQKAFELMSTHLDERVSGVTLEISSDNFIIPWELLYDGSLDAPVDASNFWGMRFIITRTLILDNRPSDMVSPIIQTSCPDVGLIAYKELDYVAANEIPSLQELHQRKKIHLSCLRSLDADQRTKELQDFGCFLREGRDIVHFACHAYMESPASHSYLYISDHFAITMQDFHAYEFTIKSNPLVILNACRTGILNPLSASNWATLFWEYGARGILATEFSVPDRFAAAFIEKLYQCLLSGISIGVSIWMTRCYFWREKNNPLGLAYALYSPLSIRIVNSS